jgi:uroporphyrinogen decarboxylase
METTGRERVKMALAHRQPDRVPVDFGSHRSSGIMAIAYRKLRDFLGLEREPIRVYDIVQQLAIIDEDVLERFRVDAIEMGRGFSRDAAHWKPWVLPDGSPCEIPQWVDVRRAGNDWILHSAGGKPIGIMKSGSLYFEQIHWPYLGGLPSDLSGIGDAMDEVTWSVPAPPGPGEDIAPGTERFRESTERAVVGLFGGNLLEWGQILFRNDNFLLLLAAEPLEAHRFLDAVIEAHLAKLESWLGMVGNSIDIILFGDDLGMQRGPQISPAMYREFFKPRHRAMWSRAKQLADVKVMLHCCGGVRPLLDDLIDAGLDTINPVQISCAGMDPAGLKKDFGSRITFWGGGCDTRDVLPSATPGRVREHVLRQLEIMSPGGGFVFQQVHNVMADVPPENVAAMFDAVSEFNGVL